VCFFNNEVLLNDTLNYGVYILEIIGDQGDFYGAKTFVFFGNHSHPTYFWHLSDQMVD
jgi:hypothetical protein